ncbi:hypothetical protein [Nostoc sp. UHCC 0870]|uniref:hypothetical protein n=1 Tax=Nostoc sp. UHCC 0870 TaxID=2914041 RepID=UPI001EDD148D|nr:hypothetical protein [Nostoc sp. UHCC 0870]UKP00343.1 hypothetical protein L6494_11860 [Nostoc sp. UHCC 0870]
MEHWQFLIQKQGDRSWQSLESPSTEIIEGRYRVLALSQLPHRDIEVRVTHFSHQETPPKRRIQKRLRRTNSDGLMAVIPFTYLKPGIWELRCSGDLMSDMLGQSWQYGVYLQVLSQEVHEPDASTEPGSFNDPSESSLVSDEFTELAIAPQSQLLATGLDQEALIDEPVNPVWVKGETAEQILQNLIDLALPTSDPLIAEEKVAESPPQQPQCPLVLTLDRETYITRWGHVLTIHGNVALQENYQPEQELKHEHFYDLELRIELRSPQSLDVLTQIRQSLGDQALPFTLRSAIDIPAECESKLILADISLYGSVSNAGEVTLLASQSFTITADVTQLLAVTTTTQSSYETSTPPTSTPEPSISLDLELFNLVKTPSAGQSPLTYPVPNLALPGSMELLSIKKEVDSRGLQLPKLPENQTEAMTYSGTQPIASQDTVAEFDLEPPVMTQDEITVPMTPAPINLEQLVIKNRRSRMLGSSFPYLKRLQPAATETEAVNSEITDTLNIQAAEILPEIDLQISENTEEYGNDQAQFTDDFLGESEVIPTPELIPAANPEQETLATSESSDDLVQETPNLPPSYSSPLIRKWMQSQGYTLPEATEMQYSDPEVLDHQITVEKPPLPTVSDEATTLAASRDVATAITETDTFGDEATTLEVSGDVATAIIETDTFGDEEIENQEYEPESTTLIPAPELLPVEEIETTLAWLAQEIVVDDIFAEEEVDLSKSDVFQVENPSMASLSIFTSLSEEPIEPLPIPQLHVPEGELIAGNSIRVRVELPKVPPQVVAKLWVEDCQTRWLLDGPHLLTDLLPNSSGGMEVMIPLNIPFGCLEIRIEAIALNRATQQESHKVTVFRTVIPPDLPNLQLDELFGL